MTDEVKNDPLAPLRQQWEADKSPKLSLQLAEEYGRRKDFLSAITVLRTGLTRHPRHVSSRILLARFLVDLEQWPEARETLEGVAGEDPTNLIANKLLVRTCLATGDHAEARNRLDLYTLLNEGDPEIESLEQALAGGGPIAERPAMAQGAEERPAQQQALEERAVAEEPAAEEPREKEPAEPEPTDDEPAEWLPATAEGIETPAATVEDPSASLAASGAGEEDPAAGSESRLAAGPSREGGEPGGDAAASLVPFAAEPRKTATGTRGGGEPFADLFDLGRRDGRSPAPPRTMPGEDIFDLAPPRTAPPPAADEDVMAPRVDEQGASLPGQDEARSTPPRGEEPPEATVSLGRLYLQQGHRQEAERTFEALLEREPGNAAARVGLAAARGAAGWVVNALDLVPRETLVAAGARERRRAVLTGYLARLRPPGTAD